MADRPLSTVVQCSCDAYRSVLRTGCSAQVGTEGRRQLLGGVGRAEVISVMPLAFAAASLPDKLAPGWQLLEREDARALRHRRASDCAWLFLNRTKNASRVWSSSADCGNRTRRRRYVRRTAEQR